jgi:GR25 family glycosyltransferase involved in LPS biosynthesis
MSYAGFYINLARSPERRKEIELQLERYSLQHRYRRFDATDGNALGRPAPRLTEGEIGCFLSHFRVLEQNIGSSEHLHIVEDDVLFSSFTEPVIESIIASEPFQQYDIVYCDLTFPPESSYYRNYKERFDRVAARDAAGKIAGYRFHIADLRDQVFHCLSSYIVSRASIAKIHDIYARELATGPAVPVDIALRQEFYRRTINVGCLFPFVTSVRLEHVLQTTMPGRHESLSVLAANLARHSFFVDCDWARCAEYLRRLQERPEPDPHRRLLAGVLEFSMSSRFRDF